MKIFLSYSFSQAQDKELATIIIGLLESHDITVITGRRLGGETLTSAIKKKINKSDALVALMTRREEMVQGGWKTHPWIIDELNYARDQKKNTIAIREEGVEVGGMYEGHEYLLLNREQVLSTILDLSKTIGIWKQEFGRTLKVQILFEDSDNEISNPEQKCSYRFVDQGEYLDWQETNLITEPGGLFAYIKGMQEQYSIQIKIEGRNNTWVSPATKWITFQLKRLETN